MVLAVSGGGKREICMENVIYKPITLPFTHPWHLNIAQQSGYNFSFTYHQPPIIKEKETSIQPDRQSFIEQYQV